MESIINEGGCLCGAVRYSVSGQPQRVVHCHCRFCQRSSGSASVVECFFPETAFVVLAGEPSVYQHRSEGSGKLLHLSFCARCGTKLFSSMERYPGTIAVLAGTFDNPEWFEPAEDLRYVFLQSARAGTVVPPGVRAFEQASISADGQLNTPQIYDDFHVVAHRTR
jgi:hypothetical protein